MDKFEEYQRLLKGYGWSNDKPTFEKWNREKITTEECWRLFLEQNERPYRKTNLNNFTEWLWSLGYIRTRRKGRKETWQL